MRVAATKKRRFAPTIAGVAPWGLSTKGLGEETQWYTTCQALVLNISKPLRETVAQQFHDSCTMLELLRNYCGSSREPGTLWREGEGDKLLKGTQRTRKRWSV